MCKRNGIQQSMGCKGNCLDHTGITSFSGSFKRDLLYLKGLAGWNFPYELVGDPGHYNSRCIKAKRKGLMLWSNGSWYFGRLPRFVLFHFDFPIFRLNPWGEGATTPLCRLLPDIARSETGQGFRKISAHPQKGTVRFPCPVKKQFPLCGLNARPRISGYPIPLFFRSIAAFHLLCYIPFP